MQKIKHRFFTYRNGMLADTLRGHGDPHKVIFGLEIPRIAEIARTLQPDMELALRLWDDREVRESRLLATYLFPVDAVDEKLAMKLCGEVRTREEADMLAFRLLKRLPYAGRLPELLKAGVDSNPSYATALAALLPHLQ